MANLPNKSFVFNYNARNYNPNTFTIPNETGASLAMDMVWTGSARNNIVASNDHITIPLNAYSEFVFQTYNDNPLSYVLGDFNLTVVFKAKYSGTNNNRGNFLTSQDFNHLSWSCRIGSREGYQVSDTRITQVIGDAFSNWDNGLSYTCGDTITGCIRAQNNRNDSVYTEIKNLTSGQSVTPFTTNYHSPWTSTRFGFFNTKDGLDTFPGDFYWCYVSREVLTDEEIAQVVQFNESNFGPDSTGTTIAQTGGTSTTNIESETGWTVTTKPTWVTVSPSSGESGTTAITFTIKKNNFSSRTGVVVFTDDDGNEAEYTIEQGGTENQLPYNKIYRNDRRIN